MQAKLYAWPEYFVGASRDIDALTGGLWATFGTQIREGRFSFGDGAFHPFDRADRDLIQRALEDDDEA